MLEAYVVVSVLAIAAGVVLIFLGIVAGIRLPSFAFSLAAANTVAALALLLVDLLPHLLPAWGVQAGAKAAITGMTAIGTFVVAYSIPRLAGMLVGIAPRPAFLAALASYAAVLLGVGVLRGVMPGAALTAILAFGLLASHVGGLLMIGLRWRSVEHEGLRKLSRSALCVGGPLVGLIFLQQAASAVPGAPPWVVSFPISHSLYLLAVEVLLLVFGMEYLFRFDSVQRALIPDEFIGRFGISPREREIIAMMMQGWGNKLIAEKLFISSTTVKNHVYHIYQKVSVRNKVQLINMIQSMK